MANKKQLPILLCLCIVLAMPWPVIAAVQPDLQDRIQRAEPGATIVVAPGRHRVNLIIAKRITLAGQVGAILDGGGEGDVIRVKAPGVSIRGLRIEHSGNNLTYMNAGIFVERAATDVLIVDNELYHNAFGVWLDGAARARVRRNRVSGDPEIRSQDRGNGIHLYNVQQAVIDDNDIWETRDGIYIDSSSDNTLRNNRMRDLRYGIHYMYSFDNRVLANHTRNTRTGYALMQSRGLTVIGNRSTGDRNYGILMNYITYSRITDNVINGVARGRGFAGGGGSVLGAEGKAIFVYNSVFNQIHDNVFSDSEIGIHITAGSEDNTLHSNAFVNNRRQIKYVANREQEWSQSGRGNYWSDYLGWDRNDDGIGDVSYEPNDAMDTLLWKYPMARILMTSPAVETLRWVQRQFPVLRPQGVRDSHPLMRDPASSSLLSPIRPGETS